MTDVIKKGLLEVKKRGRFGGYKQKYVLLSNSLTKKCKMVEILDSDGSKSSVEEIRLTDVWTVQDKPSRTRYAFELILGDDPIMTFSCATVVEREEWTEAFRVLNQLALPSMDTLSSSSPLTEYFPVTLMKNRSALEIGHSGQYLLSITSSAIVLHWKTGAIAHHWPTKNIIKLYHPGREGHLLLIVKRVSSSGPPLDFEFVTEKDLAVQILKMWNIRLLESIPGDPKQLNEISSSLTTAVTAGSKKRSTRKAKSFKERDNKLSESDEMLKRTGSFSRFSSFGIGPTLGGAALSQGSQPLPRNFRDTHAKSWTDFPDSQDSYFFNSPPPLPPRPPESSSDEDDDYAYIDENKVKGPVRGSVERTTSSELDDKLNELKKSIQRENKAKRREAEKRKALTLQPRRHISSQFVPAEPQDYLIPIPSRSSQSQSISSDCRDVADLSPVAQELSSSPTDHSPVFVGHTPTLPPRARTYGVNENVDAKGKGDYDKDFLAHAPPIPPRSPTKEFFSRKSSSSSSISSSSSAHHHCSKCRSLRKAKSSVSKTVSLDQRPSRMRKEDSRKSLPNLDSTDLRLKHHHHHCSDSQNSSSDQLATPPSSREYLPLLDKSEESELGPELDLLSSCLQTLEVLSKTSGESEASSSTKKKRNPYDHINVLSEPADTKKPAETDLDTALRSKPRDPPRTNTHRPLTSSQSTYAGSSLYSSSQRYPGGTANGSSRSHVSATRSQSSTAHAPPIPPRSTMSQPHPKHSMDHSHQNGVLRNSRTLGRSATVQAKHSHPPPPRSSSVLDHSSGYGNGQYGSYGSSSQVDTGSSGTVFIHHLKDRRLAHMV